VTLLLDTHAFLWFVLNDSSLSATARTLIIDPQNDILISPATYWEIAIKVSIGKFRLPGPFADFMEQQIAQNDLTVLPITVAHAAVVASLPFHHKDPFDRLLIAQSIEENTPVLSADCALDACPVTRLW
jgi:PIN domain nuclease of toxin-antitoxin system